MSRPRNNPLPKQTRRVFLGALGGPLFAGDRSHKSTLARVEAMKARDGIVGWDDARYSQWCNQKFSRDEHFVAVSPDCRTVCWHWNAWTPTDPVWKPDPLIRLFNAVSGERSVPLGRKGPGRCGISDGAEIIVATVGEPKVVAVSKQSGVAFHDLTRFVAAPRSNQIEDIRVSGAGMFAALGSLEPEERIQVLEIQSGKTVFAGIGRFPRISPDGKQLAFVHKERLCLRSLETGTTSKLVAHARVRGIGEWSPDSRFLPAGAFTNVPAGWLRLMNRQIIIDTATDSYGVLYPMDVESYGMIGWLSLALIENPQFRVSRV